MKIAFEWIPSDYWEESSNPGRMEKLYYDTDDFFKEAGKVRKHAWVYLPADFQYGRDYPVIYFMHGAGTDLDEWIYPSEQQFAFASVLDHMIEGRDIPPAIFVFPTYYQGGYHSLNCNKETDIALAGWFPIELKKDLIPAVDSAYIGMEKDCSSDVRFRRRKRMIFGGFSMGGVITWNVFVRCREEISVFFPFSGDCWLADWMGGSRKSIETASLLIDALQKTGYDREDFLIYAMTGEYDVALKAMAMQIEKMKLPGSPFHGKNLIFHVMEKGEHNYDFCFIYLYYALRYLFKNRTT